MDFLVRFPTTFPSRASTGLIAFFRTFTVDSQNGNNYPRRSHSPTHTGAGIFMLAPHVVQRFFCYHSSRFVTLTSNLSDPLTFLISAHTTLDQIPVAAGVCTSPGRRRLWTRAIFQASIPTRRGFGAIVTLRNESGLDARCDLR